MKMKLRAPISAAVAVLVGAVVLIGYFVELPFFTDLRVRFLQWAVILAAIALFVGILNLGLVHWRKVRQRRTGWVYSIILLVSLLLSLIVAGLFWPTVPWGQWMFNYVQVPVESSLMSVMAIVLVYACARLIRWRLNGFALVFVGTVFLTLAGTLSIPWLSIPGLAELRAWLTQVWAVAGARGILLGVALGATATAMRILVGVDRPYGG